MNDFILPRGRIHSTPRVALVRREIISGRWPAPDTRKPLISDMVTAASVLPPANTATVATTVALDHVKVREVDLDVELDADYGTRRSTLNKQVHSGPRKMTKSASTITKAVAVEQQTEQPKKALRKLRRAKVMRVGLMGLAVVVLAATGYVGFDTWQTNNQAKVQIGQSVAAVKKAESSVATPEQHQVAEGADKKPLAPRSLSSYKVAASLPRALYITKSNVAARVLPMNVNPNGSVQAPINIFDSGWYTDSVKPGEVGAMFIDGHSSGLSREGLFGNLYKLVVGDTMQIEKGDGTKLTYKVVHTAVVDKDSVDMKKMLLPYGTALRALNLMTCAGTWVNSSQTLTQRIEVFTEQV